LSEAAESLGAWPVTVLLRVVLPNSRTAILSGAFLTAAIVLGEFTFASLLDRPTAAMAAVAGIGADNSLLKRNK
jgi:putative spermidine/putrescine transport system permease protein